VVSPKLSAILADLVNIILDENQPIIWRDKCGCQTITVYSITSIYFADNLSIISPTIIYLYPIVVLPTFVLWQQRDFCSDISRQIYTLFSSSAPCFTLSWNYPNEKGSEETRAGTKMRRQWANLIQDEDSVAARIKRLKRPWDKRVIIERNYAKLNYHIDWINRFETTITLLFTHGMTPWMTRIFAFLTKYDESVNDGQVITLRGDSWLKQSAE